MNHEPSIDENGTIMESITTVSIYSILIVVHVHATHAHRLKRNSTHTHSFWSCHYLNNSRTESPTAVRHGSFRRTLFRLLANGSIVYDLHPRHAHHSLKVQTSHSSGHSKPVPTHFQCRDLRKIHVESCALMRSIEHTEKILTTNDGTCSNKQKRR